MPVKYPMDFGNWPNSVLISVYRHDGSVQITIGSIDMGQGSQVKIIPFINNRFCIRNYHPKICCKTRCAQVAADAFGIPLEMVTVRPAMSALNF